jgi:hypothetical protein
MEAPSTPTPEPVITRRRIPKGIAKKLSQVMAAVGRIPKNGYNDRQQYKFAKEDDVLECVRSELSSRSLIMVPDVDSMKIHSHTTKGGSEQRIVTLEVDFIISDGDTDEEAVFTMVGEGQDAGDKASYKAVTGATKFALLKLFLIPTGNDPEVARPDEERNQGRGQRQAPKQQAARSSRPAPNTGKLAAPTNAPQTAASLHKLRVNRLFHELQAVRGLRTDQCKSWVSPTVGDKPSNDWDDQELTELERRLKEEP